jgi:hypothetical protein
MLNVLNEYLFLSAGKDTKKSTYFQIIDVVLQNNDVVLQVNGVVLRNHTVD